MNASGNALSTGNNLASSSNMAMAQDVPNPPQMQHARSFSDTNFSMNPAANPSPPNMPQQNGGNPNITAQMYKLIEQQRARHQQQQQQLQPQPQPVASNQMLGGNPIHNIAPSTNMLNRLNMPTNMPMPGQMPSEAPRQPVWQGPMIWSGVSAAGKKNIRAYVAAFYMQGAEWCVLFWLSLYSMLIVIFLSHEHTWPAEMTLAPTKDNLVSDSELTFWINRHKPAVCQIHPQPNVPDPERNNANFKSLIALLTDRKIVRCLHPRLLEISILLFYFADNFFV